MFWFAMLLAILIVAFPDQVRELAEGLGWEPPEDVPCVMVQFSDIIAAEFERPWWEGGRDPR